MKRDTVLQHLVQAYSEQPEKLRKLLDESIIERIQNAYETLDKPEKLKPIFEHLEGEICYTDIRIAMLIIK